MNTIDELSQCMKLLSDEGEISAQSGIKYD
ncbi:hypothetical protein SAMN05444162_4308 [Paenibacillaceae bacterium GAS479]|nr:hypothetical protein SAMN05444162_4308 [Paenibacillaceae bacterium GAS479]